MISTALESFGIVCRTIRVESSRTRARLPHEVHTAIFDWVLALIAEAGLVKGARLAGMDRQTLRDAVVRYNAKDWRGFTTVQRATRRGG